MMSLLACADSEKLRRPVLIWDFLLQGQPAFGFVLLSVTGQG
jgi:hypothetical protein